MDLDYVNIGDLTDAEVTIRMRKCNYEKFKTLVRMHLSFELDLNTDEFDLPCHEIVYEDKGKLKKWNRMSKKHKFVPAGTTGCATSKGSASAGCSPTEGLHQQIDAGFLFHLEELKDFLLLEKNVCQEGLFRKTGAISRQNELRLQMQNEKPLDLEGGGYSAHDCATVFKAYLSELPEPLLTDAHYPAHMQIAPLCIGTALSTSSSSAGKKLNPERIKREQRLLNSMQLLLLLLPEENRQLLQHIIEMLHIVAEHEAVNKMSPDNLGTLFAPHLICPRNLPPEALHYVAKKMSGIIVYMIIKGNDIFEVPSKLSTDIRAYYLERKRKKTMSPEQTLDESISDISTVNTVYTFVDREKTAAAHTTNTTDTELAQLYAHIQSLPESSKKRRLIKQFNKQNGQGTPLQLVVLNRIKNSDASRSAKSIGDSIKKHIFHKGLMSRTPKRTTATSTMPSGIHTPNISNYKTPKLRVLFQSPLPNSNDSTPLATPSAAHAAAAATGSVTIPHITITTATLLPSTSSTCTPYASNHPSYNTKLIQKSVSSTSLTLNTSIGTKSHKAQTSEEQLETSSSSSSDVFLQHTDVTGKIIGSCSASAPVSRQTSSDLSMNPTAESNPNLATFSDASSVSSSSSGSLLSRPDTNMCVTPLKRITEAAKHLFGGEKKNVVWGEHRLLDIEEMSNPCTPTDSKKNTSELKSRYKSEPNLSRIATKERSRTVEALNVPQTPIFRSRKSFTRKLMKGVSMSNIRLPFTTPENKKRLGRSVSSTLRRRASHDDSLETLSKPCYDNVTSHTGRTPLLAHPGDYDDDDLDDETFQEQPNDNLYSDSSESNATDTEVSEDELKVTEIDAALAMGAGSSSNELPLCSNGKGGIYQQLLLQQSGLYRNNDLVTSTPSTRLFRRSMSPITKSTQRMPKAMQESIMTPRSRKPVMLLTTAVNDANQTLNDPLEDDKQLSILHNEDANSLDAFSDILKRKQQAPVTKSTENLPQTSLTNNFREYLLRRSVSPVDASFQSQSDDFTSTQELEDIETDQLSSSLLYCLDGNEPASDQSKISSTKSVEQQTPVQEVQASTCTSDESVKTFRKSYTPPACNSIYNSFPTNPFVMLNNARKRAATNDSEKSNNSLLGSSHNNSSSNNINNTSTDSSRAPTTLEDKENCESTQGYLSKKLLITEYTGETSF